MSNTAPTARRSPASAIVSALEAFWLGFTQPTKTSLGLLAVTFAAAVIAFVISVTPSMMAGPSGAFVPNTSSDAVGFATRRVYQLALGDKPTSGSHNIYVLGNSLTAQALADESALKSELDKRADGGWNVYFLTTPQQAGLDEAALVDYATVKHPGLVVMPIGVERLGNETKAALKSYQHGSLGFRSDLADEQLKQFYNMTPRRKTGIFLVDNRFFLLTHATLSGLRFITRRPAQQKLDVYLFPRTDETLRRIRIEILRHLRSNYIPQKLAVQHLSSTVKLLRERGSRVVFLEIPVSATVMNSPADQRLYQLHLQEAEKLSNKLGGYYCRLPDGVVPPDSAFRDYYHMEDPNWQRIMRVRLAQCAATAMKKGNS